MKNWKGKKGQEKREAKWLETGVKWEIRKEGISKKKKANKETKKETSERKNQSKGKEKEEIKMVPWNVARLKNRNVFWKYIEKFYVVRLVVTWMVERGQKQWKNRRRIK